MNVRFGDNVSLVYHSLKNIYCGIYIIDLKKGSVSVIENYFKDRIIYTYAQLSEAICSYIHNVNDYKSVNNELSIEALTAFFKQGNVSKRLELILDKGQMRQDYIEISIVACNKIEEGRKFVMFFKNDNTRKFIAPIVERHVYQNGEYLLIIDTMDHKFDLYRINQSGDLEKIAIYNDYKGLPLMLSELEKLDHAHVDITKNLGLEQLKRSLLKQKECRLYYDVKNKNGELHHKRIKYFYDEQSKQKIMMMISDISDDDFAQMK